MKTMTELLDAAREANEAEIASVMAEIARQEGYAKMINDWCEYTLERLRFRLSVLIEEVPLVEETAVGPSAEER